MKNTANPIKTFDSLTFKEQANIKVATVNEITEETPAYIIDKKMMLKLLSLFSLASFETYKMELSVAISNALTIEEVRELMEEAVYISDFFRLKPVAEVYNEESEKMKGQEVDRVEETRTSNQFKSDRVRVGDDNDH